MQADSVILLDDGCIKAHGSPEEILKLKKQLKGLKDDSNNADNLVEEKQVSVSTAMICFSQI